MPMQIVFPIAMVGVGVAGAGGLVVLCNKMLYGKSYRPVMVDEFDDDLITRDAWVKKQNALNKKMRQEFGQ